MSRHSSSLAAAVLAAVTFASSFGAPVPAAAQEFGFGFADTANAAEAQETEAPAVESGGQESPGFGFITDATASGSAVSASGAAPGTRVGGGVEFAASAFFAEFDDPADASLANGSTGRLDFEAKGGRAEAAFKLKISEAILSENPSKLIDEAYVRLFIGPAAVEGGLLKVVWGKADSQSVLDVLNPLDLTDLSITDNLERKIGQPMLRASASIGLSSKIDAAFIPYFTPNSVAWEGRWMPAQIGSYKKLLGIAALEDAEGKIDFPDTETLEYAQGGFRFTTTVGSVDLGAQYFCGLLPTMAVSPKDVKAYLTAAAYHAQNPAYPEPSPIPVSYDRYHQAGADAAAELFGLNWRAETGLNLTGDLGGDDPDVYNPQLVWNLGFDRDLFSGISLNLQGSGGVRLFNSGVEDNGALDLEDGTEATKTKITAYLTQKLFKDTVEWKIAGIWGVEDGDFFIFPNIGYILDDARIDLALGLFGGNDEGELGQFADASYLKLTLSYSF
jgi:hypothetical protein